MANFKDLGDFQYRQGTRKFTRTRKSLKKFSFTTTDAIDISSTFVKTKAGVLAIKALNEHAFLRPEYLVIKLSDITLASTLTIRIATDSDGDNTIFPDTEATIATALTTSGVGTVAYSIQLPFVDTTDSATSFYLFAKTDVTDDVNITSADLYCTVETY
jgi:hypothetical protein